MSGKKTAEFLRKASLQQLVDKYLTMSLEMRHEIRKLLQGRGEHRALALLDKASKSRISAVR